MDGVRVALQSDTVGEKGIFRIYEVPEMMMRLMIGFPQHEFRSQGQPG